MDRLRPTAISYRTLGADVAWLRDLLGLRGIEPEVGSPLLAALDIAGRFSAWLEAPRGDLARDGMLFSGSLDLAYLARALRYASVSPSFPHLERKLKNLAIREEREVTKDRSETFELEVGAVLAGAGYNVEIKEPDVVLSGDELWRLACKLPASDSAVTLGDRLQDGVKQCLDEEGGLGLVIFGMDRLIGHRDLLPPAEGISASPWLSFSQPEELMTELYRQMFHYASTLRSQSDRLIRGREDTRFRGLVLVGRTTALVAGTATHAASVKLVPRDVLFGTDPVVGPEYRLVERFVATLNSIGGLNTAHAL